MIVEVVPYNLGWPKAFQQEKQHLTKLLGGLVLELHHIGSTSVAGLYAKPIIDMILEVDSLAQLDEVSDMFERLGYEVMGEFGIEGRRYYRKGGNNRTHQIHAFERGDANINRHLAFRDYLVAHPEVKLEYQNLKVELARDCNHDIDKYCDGKDDFVKLHEKKALAWMTSQTESA